MIDPLGFSLIPKEKQEEIRKEAEVFAWKFRFCTYEDDRDLRNIVARLSLHQREALDQHFKKIAWDFCRIVMLSRGVRSNHVQSPFLGELEVLFRYLAFGTPKFQFGSVACAVGVIECCLKCHGWELNSEWQEGAWLEAVNELTMQMSFDHEFAPAIRNHWSLTGKIDRSGLMPVWDFRDRHDSNADALLSLVIE